MFAESSKEPSILESTEPTIDDIWMTANEVATWLRCDAATLQNLRSRGEGIPWTRRPSGGILYKTSDVLAIMQRESRGFTWARLASAIDSFPGPLPGSLRHDLLEHIKKEMRL